MHQNKLQFVSVIIFVFHFNVTDLLFLLSYIERDSDKDATSRCNNRFLNLKIAHSLLQTKQYILFLCIKIRPFIRTVKRRNKLHLHDMHINNNVKYSNQYVVHEKINKTTYEHLQPNNIVSKL